MALLAFAGPLTPQQALAANECGTGNPINCTGAQYNSGITYSRNVDATLTVTNSAGTDINNRGISLTQTGMDARDFTVTVNNAASTIDTSANNRPGINVENMGTITITNAATINTTGRNSVGINAVSTSYIPNAADDKSINITSTGNVTTTGNNSTGVNAVRQVLIGSIHPAIGDITIDVADVNATGRDSLGINATNAAGDIDIKANDVVSNATGVNAEIRGVNIPILSIQVPGEGNVSLRLGDVTSANGNGINATTGIGNASVSAGAVTAAKGFGVNATTMAGVATVTVGDVNSKDLGINAQVTGGSLFGTPIPGIGIATVNAKDVTSTGAGGVNATTGIGAALVFVNDVKSVNTGVNVSAGTGLALAVANNVTTTAADATGIAARAGGVAVAVSTGKITTSGDDAYGASATATPIPGASLGAITTLVEQFVPGGGSLVTAVSGGVAVAAVNDVSTTGNKAVGVHAQAGQGVAVALATGTVETTGKDSNGVQAYGAQFAGVFAGDVNATGANSRGVIAQATAGSALAIAGDVKSNSTGVTASATSGFVGVGVGDVTTTGADNAGGIDARTVSGDAYVVAGDVKTEGTNSTGIRAETRKGSTYIVAGDGSTSGANSAGIVNIANGSSVTIFGNWSTVGNFSPVVTAFDAASDVYILGLSATSTGFASAGVIGASILGDVNIGVGAVSTGGALSAGIVGGSILGDVNIASLFVTTRGAFSAGVVAGSVTGDVNMLLGAVSTGGFASAGVVAGSVTGDVNLLAGSVSTKGFASAGILAGSVTGNVNVGTLSASTERGFSDAINATSLYGDVNVGSLFTSTEGFASDGIIADAGRDAAVYAGAVFTDRGRSTGIQATGGRDAFVLAGLVDTDGNRSDGIVARAGSGDATVIAYDVNTQGNRSDGVRARSTGGDVTVAVGDVDTAGMNSRGVSARSDTGLAQVVVASSVYGGDGNRGAGVFMNGRTGAILSNYGEIGSRNDRAIVNRGSDSLTLNYWKVTGFVQMGGGVDQIYNGGEFAARRDSYFGGGSDLFVNYGYLTMAARSAPANVAFYNLETFDNDGGVVRLKNGIEGDYLNLVTSNFVGGGSLYFDTYLGDDSSESDMLRIGGNVVASGSGGPTALYVNDTGPGFGGYAPNGIEVVDVTNTGVTGTGDFYLPDGIIDKGLFVYDLALRPDNFWVLRSTPQNEAYEMASLVSAAQNIWYTTAGAWGQRTVDLRNGGAGFGGGGADAVLEPVVEAETFARNGVWARAVGDWGSYDADNGVSYRQDTYALQAGVDGSFDLGQGTMVVGMLGGFVKSDMDFRGTATEVDYSGATGGLYATYLQGGFYLDTLLKADILNADYANDDIGASAGADATTIGISAETGYKFQVTPTAFIEPQAQLSYVSVQMDDADFAGTGVDWDNGESLRGRLGGRVGTTITQASGAVLTPYLKASVIHEFQGDNQVNVAGFLTADDTSGTWGEVGGGLQFRTVGSVSGYVDGTYFFGNDASGGTVTGGIRHAF